MADAIGTVSAITTFVTFALEASILLYQTIKSFQSREKVIRELRDELKDLQGVLQALEELISKLDVDLTALKQPLSRCGDACTEFNALIVKCTQHSTEERSSKRDWLKLRYMGEDISGFKNMLAGYKSTITIALAYANLRTTKTTASVLEEYKELIENTQCDLENHLQDIRTRLQSLSLKGTTTTEIDAAELQRMEDEKQSTEKSLDICEQFVTLMDQSRSTLLGDLGSTSEFYQRSSSIAPRLSWLINAEGFNSAHKEFISWKLRLLQHLYEVGKQVPTKQFDLPLPSDEQTPEKQTFQEEVCGTEALLAFCKQAEKEANQPRTNYYEDVSAGDNSRLAVVTTLKDLISAKNIKSGSGSCLVLGQMSDDTVQNIFTHPAPSSVYKSK